MNSVSTCPYCNSLLEPPAGSRASCPRCGEPLPSDPAHAIISANQAFVPQRSQPAESSTVSGLSNRAVAGLIVGGMMLLFLIGLGYALWTWSEREARHPHLSREPQTTLPNPALLPGLGYLPRDVNVIAAVRPADLLESTAGKTLLQEPRALALDAAIGFVEKWTGMKPDNIDHLIVATSFKDNKLAPLILVVQTRHYYRPDVLSERLKAKARFIRDLPLFQINFESGSGYIWCVDPWVMVMVAPIVGAVRESDLDDIPSKPWRGEDVALRMAEPVREVLRRMATDSLAWTVVHIPDPRLLEAPALLFPKLRLDSGILAKNEAVGFWLVPEDKGIQLSGCFRGRNDKAASETRSLLAQWPLPAKETRIYPAAGEKVPPAELRWLQMQTRVPAEAIRDLLPDTGMRR